MLVTMKLMMLVMKRLMTVVMMHPVLNSQLSKYLHSSLSSLLSQLLSHRCSECIAPCHASPILLLNSHCRCYLTRKCCSCCSAFLISHLTWYLSQRSSTGSPCESSAHLMSSCIHLPVMESSCSNRSQQLCTLAELIPEDPCLLPKSGFFSIQQPPDK